VADETQLGRPARHARKPTKRRTPKQVKTVDGAVRIDRECSGGCGTRVRREVAGETLPLLLDIARRQATGELDVLCEACSERQEAEELAVERAREREEMVARRLAAAGIPPKWRAQAFDGLDDDAPRRRALLRAGEWARGELPGLVLWGPVGRGKTAIAAAAAHLRVQRSAVRWLPVAELLLDLRMPFDSPEYARAVRKLDAMKGRAALVLDDLDKLKPTEHAVQPLYVAVNAWIEAELPLLVTLNRDLDELMEWLPDTFGEALASRLSGYCATVEVAGRDRRIEP
jgi:DNA replication protein DnaC